LISTYKKPIIVCFLILDDDDGIREHELRHQPPKNKEQPIPLILSSICMQLEISLISYSISVMKPKQQEKLLCK